MAEKGAIPSNFLPSAREMVNFRNLVVHGYLHTGPGAVTPIIRENLNDFAVWRNLVIEILERETRGGPSSGAGNFGFLFFGMEPGPA